MAQARNRRLSTEQGKISRQVFCTPLTEQKRAAISYDEIIKLYLSVDKKYRKHGTWLMNDETALALRTLKDSAGNYLWKESDETIFSKPVQIVDSMPSIGKGQKVIAFGDFSNYWLVQRFQIHSFM